MRTLVNSVVHQTLCAKHRFLHDIFVRKYSRQVVVTGIGIVSPLGCKTERVWERLLQGHTGVTKVKGDGFEKSPSKVAAYVPWDEFMGKSYVSRTRSMAATYLLAAADEAMADANWGPQTERERCKAGVSVGIGMAELDFVHSYGVSLKEKGPRAVSPHFVPRVLLNLPGGEVAIKHHLKGANHCVSTACATGNHAIGDALMFISRGDCDVMVSGATESVISPLCFAGFTQIRALSKRFNDEPEKASRPFDIYRDGFVMGEGATVLVLEEEKHAVKRGARIYARVAGYGSSCDAANIVAPPNDGDGAKRAMAAALKDSGYSPSDVTYVNAHATSTPQGDRAECTAISSLFRDSPVAVSSTKGAVGHLLGAAGAIESAFCVLACHHGALPPTVNLEEVDPDISLDLIAKESRKWNCNGPRVALNNSFGFGGTNASLCFSSV